MKFLIDTDVRIDAQKNPKEPYLSSLKTIAQLCKESKIQPFLTEESEAEELRGMRIAVRHGDLFQEVRFELAQSPLRRSKWGLSLEQHFGPETDAAKKDKRERNSTSFSFAKCF